MITTDVDDRNLATAHVVDDPEARLYQDGEHGWRNHEYDPRETIRDRIEADVLDQPKNFTAVVAV